MKETSLESVRGVRAARGIHSVAWFTGRPPDPQERIPFFLQVPDTSPYHRNPEEVRDARRNAVQRIHSLPRPQTPRGGPGAGDGRRVGAAPKGPPRPDLHRRRPNAGPAGRPRTAEP